VLANTACRQKCGTDIAQHPRSFRSGSQIYGVRRERDHGQQRCSKSDGHADVGGRGQKGFERPSEFWNFSWVALQPHHIITPVDSQPGRPSTTGRWRARMMCGSARMCLRAGKSERGAAAFGAPVSITKWLIIAFRRELNYNNVPPFATTPTIRPIAAGRLAGEPAHRTKPRIRYGSCDLVLLAFAEVIVEG
jgi:hypothetical protein